MFYLTFQTHNWNGYLCESLFNKWASSPPQYLKKCWALMMCKIMQSTTWHRKLHTEREGLNRHATIPLPVLQLLLLSAPRAPLRCCLQAATLNVHRHGLPKFILWRKVILMQRWQSTVVQCLTQSKIWQLHVSIPIQQQVVWLDVSGPFHHSQFSPSSKESRRRYKRKNCLGFSFYARSFWLNDSGKNTKSITQWIFPPWLYFHQI
jgi:hypothetical protein